MKKFINKLSDSSSKETNQENPSIENIIYSPLHRSILEPNADIHNNSHKGATLRPLRLIPESW